MKERSRLQEMIDHVNFHWALNKVRRRVANNNVTTLLGWAALMEKDFQRPPTPWYKKLFLRLRSKISTPNKTLVAVMPDRSTAVLKGVSNGILSVRK